MPKISPSRVSGIYHDHRLLFHQKLWKSSDVKDRLERDLLSLPGILREGGPCCRVLGNGTETGRDF